MVVFVLEHNEDIQQFEVSSESDMNKLVMAVERIMAKYDYFDDYGQFIRACHNNSFEAMEEYIEIRGDLQFDNTPVRVWIDN